MSCLFAGLALAQPALAQPALAEEGQTFLLGGEDASGRALESRLKLTTRPDGTLWLEQLETGGAAGTKRIVGKALSEEAPPGSTRLRLEVPKRGGAVGSLSGASSDTLTATYRFRGPRVEALVLQGAQVLSRQSGRLLASPTPVASYSLAPNEGQIDVAAINADASALLASLTEDERAVRYPILVVPGFATADQGKVRLHPRAKKRAERAATLLRKKGAHVILCTGANVRPANTPFNEALELRRYLVEELGVPSWRVAIEPRARHTTTNVRNAGRFMLAHDLTRALVVTSRAQSFYLSAPHLSSFHRRCRVELGYEVGKFRVRSHWTTLFEPSQRVFERGSDPLDP